MALPEVFAEDVELVVNGVELGALRDRDEDPVVAMAAASVRGIVPVTCLLRLITSDCYCISVVSAGGTWFRMKNWARNV